MADLAQNLINNYMQRKSAESKQATIDTLTGLGSTQAPQAPDLAANSYIGMFGKGMEGLINFAQTGERRAAAEAQQKLNAEQVAYDRGRDALTDRLAIAQDNRAAEKFEFNKARQLRADQDKLWQQDAQRTKNALLDKIYTTNRDRAAGIKEAGTTLANAGIDLVQGTDGKWGVAEGSTGSLTPELTNTLEQLNTTWTSNITGSAIDAEVNALVERGKKTTNPYDDFSIASLTGDAEAQASKFDGLNPTQTKRVNEKVGLIQNKAQSELNSLLNNEGFAKGSVKREMLDDDLWAYEGKLGENFAQDAIMGNPSIKDKDSGLVELANRREELLADQKIAKMLEDGEISNSQFEAALGKTFSKVSDNFWQWSVGIKDDNIVKPMIQYLKNAAAVNSTQAKAQRIKDNAASAVNSIQGMAKLGVVK